MEVQRESIFVSALRSFCRIFFSIVALFLAVALCSFVYSIFAPSGLLQEKTSLEILPDAEGNQELVSPSAPAILEIAVEGIIGDPQNVNARHVQNILLDSRKGLLMNNRIRAILLYFNTPGGTVVDADNIYRMLQHYKEKYHVPIFGYVDGLCASGGMYIASAAEELFAGPASIIGSVGVVIGPFFNIADALGKIGVHAKTITEGIDKDMMNPTRPWKEGEDASLKAVTAFFYQHFVDLVANARPKLDKEKLIGEYGAQVYDCVEAEKLGYIDHAMSNRRAALLALLKKANIDPSQPYQVVTLQPKRDLFSELMSGKSPLLTGKVEHALDVGVPFLRDQVAYLYQPFARDGKALHR